jgi:RNA methyltransferase, TrmH family
MRHDPPGKPPRGPRQPPTGQPGTGGPSTGPWGRPPRDRGDAPPEREARPPRAPYAPRPAEPSHEGDHELGPSARERRNVELRLYGLNAVRAVFAKRPQAIRKLYLAEARIPALQPILKWCVANRVGYRVVDEEDLHKLAASTHHEGVVAEVLREEPLGLSNWLRDLPAGPQCAIWLDGVGNPHNFGAILRSAAHFGVGAILLPKHSTLSLSGAAARVAEGGAEVVPMVRLGRTDNAIAQLRSTGFTLAATVVQGGSDLFSAPLPQRVIYVLGAEGEGMDRELAAACDLRLSIPGTGAVESLNVAAAAAVLLASWRARS